MEPGGTSSEVIRPKAKEPDRPRGILKQKRASVAGLATRYGRRPQMSATKAKTCRCRLGKSYLQQKSNNKSPEGPVGRNASCAHQVMGSIAAGATDEWRPQMATIKVITYLYPGRGKGLPAAAATGCLNSKTKENLAIECVGSECRPRSEVGPLPGRGAHGNRTRVQGELYCVGFEGS